MVKRHTVLFFALVSWLVLGMHTSARADDVSPAEFPATVEGLKAEIANALEENDRDFDHRLALAAHIYQVAESYPTHTEEFTHSARFIEAMANMRLGYFDKSKQQVEALCPLLRRPAYALLRFRCDALNAILTFIRGERKQSLEAFEVLFAQNNDAIPQKLLARTQIGYAAVLNENGRSAQAVDLYERLLIEAIENQYDKLALYAGNNLIVILITQQDYAAAQRALDQLGPITVNNPDSLVFGSLRLHELELQRVSGDIPAAIAGLTSFIADEVDSTPLMLGSAHRLLADALTDAGRHEEAIYHGHQAIELLRDQAHEVNDVHTTLARIYIHQKKFDEALEQLSNIDMESESVPARRAHISRSKLEAIVRSGQNPAAIEAFEALVSSESEKDDLATTTRAEYYEARLKTAQREIELRKAEELAREQAAKNAAERRNTRLILWLAGASVLVVCVIVGAYVSRTAERRRLAQEQEQNRVLEELVEQRTEELMSNLEAQADMTLQLERQKRVEATGKLVGNVAHDFNNLLQVVLMSNETISKSTSNQHDQARALALSDQALDHGARILRQLMSYSRQQDLEGRPLRFEHYLKESTALLRFAVGAENTLVLNDKSEGAIILVDSAQLTTSILNLISNAVDAMPYGGRVALGASLFTVADKEEHWSTTIDPGQYLLISVSDDGEGMSSYEVERALEPFFTTKEEHAGTGLGLSSVYGFVNQSGGDLRILSRVGQGTTVEFFIPTVPDGHAVEEKPVVRPSKEEPLAGLRLLLVEDHDQVAGVLETMLRSLKLDVYRVSNAQDAQQYLTQQNFDIDFMFSDIHMPGDIDGMQLATWVRHQSSRVRILLMSGFNDSGAEEFDFMMLQKPFTSVDMANSLVTLLSQPPPSPGQSSK